MKNERITQLQQELAETFQHARAIQSELKVLWEEELRPNVEVELPVTQSAVVGYLTPERQVGRLMGRIHDGE